MDIIPYSTPDATTSAHTVKIGDLEMNKLSGVYPDEDSERFGLGQPNPTRITWSKSNEIAIHKIPYPKWKSMRTSKESLWTLDIEFVVLTKKNMETVRELVNDVGPHDVSTYFLKMKMYIQSFNATADAGFTDSRWVCSMKLVEVSD